MPNWCSNYATFTHEDPEQINRLIKAAVAGKLFSEFLPCPPELLEEVPTGDDYVQRRDALIARNKELHGYDSWYEWNVDNWGTKWDIGEVDEDNFNVSEDGKSVSFWFDTAWAPPLNFYDDIPFTVTAYYYETGMGFCGKWTSDDGDDYYEVSSDNSIEDIERQELIKKLIDNGYGEIVEALLEDEKKVYTKKGRLNKSGACRKLKMKSKQLEDKLAEMRSLLSRDLD